MSHRASWLTRRGALAGAGARGRGPAVRRAARAADPALRRPAHLGADALVARPRRARGGRRGRRARSRSTVISVGRIDGLSLTIAEAGARRRSPAAGRGGPPRGPAGPAPPGCVELGAAARRLNSPGVPRTPCVGAARPWPGCGRVRQCWRPVCSSSSIRPSTPASQERVRRRLGRWLEGWVDRRLGALARLREAARGREPHRRRAAASPTAWSRSRVRCAAPRPTA